MQPAVYLSFRPTRFRLPTLSLILLPSSATLESSLIPTSVRPTHVRRTVSRCSPLFVSFVIFVATSPTTVFRSPVVSRVRSRLDYGNLVLVGSPVYRQRRLQSVLNAAARLASRLRRHDHVSEAISVLHYMVA